MVFSYDQGDVYLAYFTNLGSNAAQNVTYYNLSPKIPTSNIRVGAMISGKQFYTVSSFTGPYSAALSGLNNPVWNVYLVSSYNASDYCYPAQLIANSSVPKLLYTTSSYSFNPNIPFILLYNTTPFSVNFTTLNITFLPINWNGFQNFSSFCSAPSY